MPDRGVSDVLGYALVFALIVSVVGMVYVSGFGGLTHVKDAEKLTNAQRAFDVLDSNLDDLAHGTAASRGTEIKLQDARLGFGDPVTINVSVAGQGSYTGTMTPIFFEGTNGNARIVAVDGAVLRANDQGSVMVNDPGFVFGNVTVVPMVITRTTGSGVSGSGRVLVRTVVASRSVVDFTPTAGQDVTINVTTAHPRAWSNYLTKATGTDCTTSGGTVSCSISADRVYVQVVRVDVSLD